MVQSFILRLERGNRVTEHLDCYKIELIQNYHDLVSFSVIALIGFRDINVNTDCLEVKVFQPNFYMCLVQLISVETEHLNKRHINCHAYSVYW